MPQAVLVYLREHSERVISREEFASEVWKLRLDGRSRVIDQTVSLARKKLETSERIVTVHGIGYQHRRVKLRAARNGFVNSGAGHERKAAL